MRNYPKPKYTVFVWQRCSAQAELVSRVHTMLAHRLTGAYQEVGSKPMGWVHADPLWEIAQQHPAVSIGSYPAGRCAACQRPPQAQGAAWLVSHGMRLRFAKFAAVSKQDTVTVCASALVATRLPHFLTPFLNEPHMS